MTRLEVLHEAHMQSRAVVAWRMAGGDYRAALAHLEAMAGTDIDLASAIRRAGLAAALRITRGNGVAEPTPRPVVADPPAGNGTLSPQEMRIVAQTGGLYRAHHPNDD